jgi:hypothetical protein
VGKKNSIRRARREIRGCILTGVRKPKRELRFGAWTGIQQHVEVGACTSSVEFQKFEEAIFSMRAEL